MSYPTGPLHSNDQKWVVPFGQSAQPASVPPPNGAGSAAAAAVAPAVFDAMTAATPSGAGSAKLQNLSIADKIRNRIPFPVEPEVGMYEDGWDFNYYIPHHEFSTQEATDIYIEVATHFVDVTKDYPYGHHEEYFDLFAEDLESRAKAGPIDKTKLFDDWALHTPTSDKYRDDGTRNRMIRIFERAQASLKKTP